MVYWKTKTNKQPSIFVFMSVPKTDMPEKKIVLLLFCVSYYDNCLGGSVWLKLGGRSASAEKLGTFVSLGGFS